MVRRFDLWYRGCHPVCYLMNSKLAADTWGVLVAEAAIKSIHRSACLERIGLACGNEVEDVAERIVTVVALSDKSCIADGWKSGSRGEAGMTQRFWRGD